MIIGVDADGVLTNMQDFNFQYGQRFFRKKIVNSAGYSIKEIYEVSSLCEILYGLKYFQKYCKECMPRENAARIIKRLTEEGNTLHEITARKFSASDTWYGRCSKKRFLNWLEKHDFSFSSITFCSEKEAMADKYEACKRLSVEVMIDDSSEIAMYLAERGIHVFLMDAPYNQGVHCGNTFTLSPKRRERKKCAKRVFKRFL